MDIVITCYFTKKHDPLRKNYQPSDSDKILGPWSKSLKKNNLQGLVFSDNLSEEFKNKYRDDNLDFVDYDLNTGWSINDERFLAYYNFLKEDNKYERILLTDLFDVLFYGNPFKIITKPDFLYAGDNMTRPIKRNTFVNKKMRHAYGKILYSNEITVNAGVIGGYKNTILRLLEKMVNDFYRVNNKKNLNMAVFNKNVYELFGRNKIHTGSPLTSRLKKYEEKGNFAVKHK